MIPRFCYQFTGIHKHPWLPSTLLHISEDRLEVPTTSPCFPFEGVLGSLMSQTLILKTFDPPVVTSLANVSIFTLTLSIMLIAITISFTPQLLKVTGCSFLLLLYCHSQLLNLMVSSFLSARTDLAQTPSPGQSSCSDSALWTAVTSWRYVFLVSLYK